MQTQISKQKNLLTVAMVAALSVSAPRARASQKGPIPRPAEADLPQLQLTVDLPSHWRPFLSDDLAEAFASRLTNTFRRRGYSGEIKFLDHEVPNPEIPLLAVQVINWRIGHGETAECSITATLTVNENGHQHELGVFENTSLAGRTRPMGRAEALAEVADGALKDLSIKLDQAGLLQGFAVSNG